MSLHNLLLRTGCSPWGFAAAMGLTLLPSTVEAQVPPAHRAIYDGTNGYVRPGYGYWGANPWNSYGWGYGGTAASAEGEGLGQAAAGLGQMAEGFGQYQKDNAQAQVVYQQAETEYLKNLGLKREMYESGIAAQKQADAAAYKVDREKVEAYKRDMSQRAAPHRLTADQFDRDNEIIHWPMVLRHDAFTDSRYKLDQLFAERTPANSGADSDSSQAIRTACDEMMTIVNAHVKDMDIDQFITAQHFVSSLAYESKFKVSANSAK